MAPIEKTEIVRARVTPELRKACEAAAKEAGLTLSDWARQVFSWAVTERPFALTKGGKPKKRK